MKFKDIADLSEDERIDQIGRAVMHDRKKVAFVTDLDDDGGHSKADRYVEKLTTRFPGIRIVSRGNGPVPDVEYVTVAPPAN